MKHQDILLISDNDFSLDNVCIIAGAGTKIGRAACIAAVNNNLMVIGLDQNEKEGKTTQRLAREAGGQMIFEAIDWSDEVQLGKVFYDSSQLGLIKYMALAICESSQIALSDGHNQSTIDSKRFNFDLSMRLSRMAVPYMISNWGNHGVIVDLKVRDKKTIVNSGYSSDNYQRAVIDFSEAVANESKDRVKYIGVELSDGNFSDLATDDQTIGVKCDESKKKPVDSPFSLDRPGSSTASPSDLGNLLIFLFSRYSTSVGRGGGITFF